MTQPTPPAVPDEVFVRALRTMYARRFPDHDLQWDLLLLDRDVHEDDFRAALAVAFAAGRESVHADAEREWDKQEQAAHALAEEPY